MSVEIYNVSLVKNQKIVIVIVVVVVRELIQQISAGMGYVLDMHVVKIINQVHITVQKIAPLYAEMVYAIREKVQIIIMHTPVRKIANGKYVEMGYVREQRV